MVVEAQIQDQQVQKALTALQKKLKDRRPIHRTIERRLVTRVQQTFRTATDPWGNRWEPLKGRSGKPLNDSGRLKRSIPAASTSDSDSSAVGTNVRYGLVHQEGRTIKAKPGNPGTNFVGKRKGSPFLRFKLGDKTVYAKEVEIPARPFLPIRNGEVDLPEEWQQSVLEAIQQHLDKATGVTA